MPRIASIAGSMIHNPFYTPDERSGFASYLEGAKPRYARLYISQANWLYSVAVQQKTQRS
ncbi:MAG: hypothetical protein KME55_40580 [Nostoc indistinguendum CM1-VF10]|nr:hypothetical protein [Nostoc indistinguendum CM1-VF10]